MLKIIMSCLLAFSFLFAAVDINTATKEELLTLKGIGEKKVEAIIKYRATKKFENIEEIQKVKGIGPKLFEKIKKDIVVSKSTAQKDIKNKNANKNDKVVK